MTLEHPWDQRSVEWPYGPDDLITVVEVGGYEGRWVEAMLARYRGAFHVYEPQLWAFARIIEKLSAGRLQSLHLHPYGLGPEDAEVTIGGWGTDAASILKTPEWHAEHPEEGRRDTGQARIVEVGRELSGLGPIDVLLMNIEGYEYLLLPAMMDAGLLPSIRFVMVQFHRDYPASATEADVLARLAETHDIIWEYPALTAWERKA